MTDETFKPSKFQYTTCCRSADMFAFRITKTLARVLDILFASVIVAPLVVVFWYTSWTILDYYVFPSDRVISAGISFVIGFCGQFLVMFYQKGLEELCSTSEKRNLLDIIVTKVFALVMAVTSVSLWRGTWIFADLTTPDDNFTIAINITQNTIIMSFSKSFRNSIAALFVVALDQHENNFVIPTYFKRVVS